MLIKGGADVNVLNEPLHAAVSYGKPKVVEILIKNGANVNAQNNHKNIPLHLVAAFGDTEKHLAIAELLVNNGADVNAKDIKK